MNEHDFRIKFQGWQNDFLFNKKQYGNQVWEALIENPLDILFMELAELYKAADEGQRLIIEKFFERKPEWTWQLVLFIRRTAKLLNLSNKDKMVNAGWSIANLVSKKDDFRDIIVSLVILKYAADKSDIDIRPSLETAMINANEVFKNILTSTLNHNHSSVVWTVKNFGPTEWANELE
jgi:hypothetical protein